MKQNYIHSIDAGVICYYRVLFNVNQNIVRRLWFCRVLKRAFSWMLSIDCACGV